MAFNTVVGAVQLGLIWENVEQFSSEVPSSLNLLDQLHHANNTEHLSRPRCFFVEGPGVTMNKYLINAIRNCLNVRCKGVRAVPISSVTVKRIKKSSIDHSDLVNTVPCGAEDIFHISVDSDDAQKLREVSLVIWNEIVWCHRHWVESLDSTLKSIM